MLRPTDATTNPREGGDGNRRRRDRHRRGDRGDRPERGDAPTGTFPARPRRHADRAGIRGSRARDHFTVSHGSAAARNSSTPGCAGATASRVRAAAHERSLRSGNGHRSGRRPHAGTGDHVPPKPAQPQSRPTAALPPVSMSLPADSGLELVETRSKATLMPEPEPAPAAGPRRVRPPRPVIAEEPLQIIETRKENSPPAG